jgi:hypothetical protein
MANHAQLLIVVIATGTHFRPLWAALSHHGGKSPDQLSLRHGGDSPLGDGKVFSLSSSPKMSLLSHQTDSSATGGASASGTSSEASGDSASDGFVPDQVLHNIHSIECLENKMEDVSSNCGGPNQVAKVAKLPYDESYCSSRKKGELLSISTYPHFSDGCCHSGGEYFCDPDEILSEKDQKSVQKDLNVFSSMHPVQCPRLAPYRYFQHNENYDQRVDRSFWLGVALAKDLPPSESDPDSLQTMGLLLLSKWGLVQPLEVCSHAAILIIVPGERVAHIATSSCEFICAERGGPEVVTAVLGALDTGGIEAAVKAGILETGRVVKKLDRLARQKKAKRAQEGIEEELIRSERAWSFTQQAIFGLIIGAIFMTICGGIIICLVPSCREKAENEIFGDPRFSLSMRKALVR